MSLSGRRSRTTMNKKFSDYWKNNIALGIQRIWEWLGVRGIIIDVIISLIAGLLIAQNAENRLGVAQTAGITIAIAFGIYILLALISVIFIVPYQETRRLEKIIANYKKKGHWCINQKVGAICLWEQMFRLPDNFEASRGGSFC